MMRAGGDSTPLRPNSAGARPLSAVGPQPRPASAGVLKSPIKPKRSNCRMRALTTSTQVNVDPRAPIPSVADRNPGGFMPSDMRPKPLTFDDASSMASTVSSQSLSQLQSHGGFSQQQQQQQPGFQASRNGVTRLPQLTQHRSVWNPTALTQASSDNEPNSPWSPKENMPMPIPNRKSSRNEDPGLLAAWSPLSSSQRQAAEQEYGRVSGRHHERDGVESLNRAAMQMRISSIGRESTQLSTAGSPQHCYSSPSVSQRGPMSRVLTSQQPFHAMSTQSDCGPMLDATQDTTLTQAAHYRYNTDFAEVQLLGRGYFGQVNLCKDKNTGELVAVKRLGPFGGRHEAKQYIKETTILTCIRGRSRHVVQLLASFIDGQIPSGHRPRGAGHAHGYLVMPYCPHGTFASALEWRRQNGVAWTEAEVITFVAEMAEALHTLHAHDIAHVDFKPENILIETDLTYVLTDFGLAQFIDPTSGRPVAGKATGAVPRPARVSSNGTASQARDSGGRMSTSTTVTNVRHSATTILFPDREETQSAPSNGLITALAHRSESVAYSLNTQVSQDEGDSRYVSPDMLNHKSNFFAGDVFSLGVTVFEMMVGEAAPRNGPAHSELRMGDRNLLLARYPKLTSGQYSTPTLELLFALLCPFPDRALSAFDVLRHPAISAGCVHAMQFAMDSVAAPLPAASWRPLPRVPLDGSAQPASGKFSPDPTMQPLDGTSPLSDHRCTQEFSTRSPLNVGNTGLRHRQDSDSPMDADTTPTFDAVDGDHTPLPIDTSPTATYNAVDTVAVDKNRDALMAITTSPQFIQMRFAAAQMMVLQTILRTQVPLRAV